MVKVKCFIDKDYEEIYLNEMSAKGWALEKIICFKNALFPVGFYVFSPCSPRQYKYRMDLQPDLMGKGLAEHIRRIESTGAELISERKNWLCFRREKDFAFKTKNETKLNYYKKLRNMYLFMFFAILVFLSVEYYYYYQADGNVEQWIMWMCGFFALVGICMLVFASKARQLVNDLKVFHR